jgi:hypothetical protein
MNGVVLHGHIRFGRGCERVRVIYNIVDMNNGSKVLLDGWDWIEDFQQSVIRNSNRLLREKGIFIPYFSKIL